MNVFDQEILTADYFQKIMTTSGVLLFIFDFEVVRKCDRLDV